MDDFRHTKERHYNIMLISIHILAFAYIVSRNMHCKVVIVILPVMRLVKEVFKTYHKQVATTSTNTIFTLNIRLNVLITDLLKITRLKYN